MSSRESCLLVKITTSPVLFSMLEFVMLVTPPSSTKPKPLLWPFASIMSKLSSIFNVVFSDAYAIVVDLSIPAGCSVISKFLICNVEFSASIAVLLSPPRKIEELVIFAVDLSNSWYPMLSLAELTILTVSISIVLLCWSSNAEFPKTGFPSASTVESPSDKLILPKWNLRFESLKLKTELSGKAFDNVKVLLGFISNEVDLLENWGSRKINDSVG